MAALRASLQRDLFSPGEERLVGLVHVTSAGKKKKASPCFLCVAVTSDQSIGAAICKVKKIEKNNGFKKKNIWPLKELKLVDGIDGNKDTANFDLQLDKVYHWTASNVQERLLFFAILSKLCSKYLPKQSPLFVNMPHGVLEESVTPQTTTTQNSEDTNQIEASIAEEDYQALTDKEEKDLERLLSESDNALGNAEKFMEQLSKELSLLDGANIQSLMGSEAQIMQLLSLLEKAENEAAGIENELESYENMLAQARVAMATVGEKNLSSLEIANRNYRLLLMELNNLVAQLDIPYPLQQTLNNADLNSQAGLQNAIVAARALQKAMSAELKPGLEKMSAVQDQKKQLEKWRAQFTPTVTRQLNNLFIHLSNDTGETSSQSSKSSNSSQITVSLAKHSKMHTQLQIYAPLMHWLKATDNASYEKLLDVYTASICKLYERDLRQFFEEARSKVLGFRERKLRGSDSGSDLGAKHTSLSMKNPAVGGATATSPTGPVTSPSQNLLGTEKDLWAVEVDISERKRLEDLLECALAELEPVCLVEQDFCVSFFALDHGTVEQDDVNLGKPQDRAINDEVRKMMSILFAVLEPELVSFLATFEKVDSFSPLYVLVRLGQHVLSATDTGSFLSLTFGSSLVHVKRAFDRFFTTQLRSIEESKQPRNSKCGILPFVSNFEEFAKIIESIFRTSERRVDVDKWYTKLVRAMFDVIPRIAVENTKTPADVIKMENYHRLHALLSQLKISVLEAERKEAKQKYQEALQSYVIQYFGRPLEKLNLFFEGVQSKVAQGVKESEIGYHMAFSKQELRKVIGIYPGREVKKGIESLYRKVEKHLSDEGNLFQVVWRAMQEEFIRQYKSLEDMIQRCYPGALITLEFTMSNILEYFSDIARSH